MSNALGRARVLAGLATITLLAACAAPVTHETRVYESAGPATAVAGPQYGTVRRIEVEETKQNVSGGGAVLGAVIGGVLGNQIGGGVGRGAATALGAVGGGVLGHRIEGDEARLHSGTRYLVVVRLDNGQTRRFDLPELNGLRVGARVRADRGALSPA